MSPNAALSHPALAAPIDLNGPGHYLDWGVIQISLANLVVILLMVTLFTAAVLLPFPGARSEDSDDSGERGRR